MHGHFRHTLYIKTISVDCVGAFFYWTILIWRQRTIRQYHSDLFDQSALQGKLGLGLRLDLKLHYFSIFRGE